MCVFHDILSKYFMHPDIQLVPKPPILTPYEKALIRNNEHIAYVLTHSEGYYNYMTTRPDFLYADKLCNTKIYLY